MEAKIVIFTQTEACTIYTIQFADKNVTEFRDFLNKFQHNDETSADFDVLLRAFGRMIMSGIYERNFRNEGKVNDRVAAMPVYKSKLRLYCLRLSDKIAIIGNGGLKETRTYEEDAELNGKVLTLQRLDKQLRKLEKDCIITIEEKEITNIDKITFDL